VKQPLSLPPVKSPKNKKKSAHPLIKGLMIGFSFCLLCVGLFGAGLFFNIADLKTTAIAFLQIEQTQADLLAQKQLDLDTSTQYLNDSLTKLAADQNQVKLDKAEVDKQKAENNKLKASLTTEKLETDQLVAIYTAMSPQKAADIFAIDEGNKQAVTVLKSMDQKTVAQILSLMTPAKASQILAAIAK